MKDVMMYTGTGITAYLGIFIHKSLEDIAIWLLVMLCVIIADLFAAIYKVCKRDDLKFRISKGVRDTMGKIAMYFSFVVAVVFVQSAANIKELAMWACLSVICGEGISIASNILKAHGYNLDVKIIIQLILGKLKLDKDLIKKESTK